ncbi:MAG: FlgD immunoglobulin-like domain containing protein [Candidatus Fermentibacter sp.]|nr:FlgD immunoglobulin-like domain containing protein [Candidatus Fermentibacter sp.]
MLFLPVVASLLVGAAGSAGHSTVEGIMPDGSYAESSVTECSPGATAPSTILPGVPEAGGASGGYRASTLWVDRAHQNAIAEETAISGGGEGIFTSWYLNNTRVSRYVTCGSSTPQWTYPVSTGGGNVDIASAAGLAWSATNNVLGTLAWLGSGGTPTLMADPGSHQDISEDGTRLVFADIQNNLVCLNTSTGAVLWTVPISTVGNGIYGVDISANNSRVLVSAYDASTGAQVYSMSNGALVGSPVGNYGQTRGVISGDGSRFVLGDFNGKVRMYAWSGSAWQLSAQITSGDSWVTSVAISDDGLTVAAGTLGFSPYKGRVLCIGWPSGGTPSSLWQYGSYGDEVSSVAVCDDGSVIVAGSWGQYGGTSGDVFTAFDHDGGIIFHLLDGIDEPGSIYSVDISDDGSFATASGKAVHAREMGNGGEVYSIQIMAAQQHDVGVVAVLSPAENQQVGNTVTPQVTVSNLGLSSETFGVSAVIRNAGGTTVWSDNATVTGLGAGQETNVSFDSWTIPSYGSWTFTAQTLLAGDSYHGNDTLSTGLRAYHDAAAISVLCPYAENTIGMSASPVVAVQNTGTYTESITVSMQIQIGGSQVYSQSTTVAGVAAGASAQATLPAWIPAAIGSGQATASVSVADDYVPGNNSALQPVEIVYEIIYDDGEWDTYYWVGSLDDDMFATRFTPTIDTPFRATLFRVHVNSTEPFDWAALCPDNGSGMPDIANPYYTAENLSAPSAPAWLEVPLDVWIDDPGDLWFVTHWPDTKALGVGTDLDQPRTNRSWWHNASSGWVNMTAGDWSFRLTLEPETGIEGGAGPGEFSLGLPRPNPSHGSTCIPVEVPASGGAMRLAVYDMAGRCIEILAEGEFAAGTHSIRWDGCTADGSAAPAGLYFMRLDAPGSRQTGRMILIR